MKLPTDILTSKAYNSAHVHMQRLVFISLVGTFNRVVMRHLSIGHIFFINVTFAA